jgi:hypothetical protein
MVAIAWLPLLIFSALAGEAVGGEAAGSLRIPFLRDFAANARFLVSLALLVMAEAIIDPKVKHAVRHFVESGLVSREQLPAFESVIAETLRLRDAVLPTVLLVAIAYAPSIVGQGGEIMGADAPGWHTLASRDGVLSPAGWWFAFVSVPLYRLWLLRAVWLIVLWTTFLMRVAGLRLAWVPTHPDKAAGLGFLAYTQLFFGWIGFAASISVAAKFANMIAYQGRTISDLKFLMIASSVLITAVLAAPLVVFSRRLLRIKERGLFDYGTLGTRYVQEFDNKWIRKQPPRGEPLLGTADLQSLADLSNDFGVVRQMRVTLIDKQTLLWLAIPAVLPMLILLAVETPVEEWFRAVVRLIA